VVVNRLTLPAYCYQCHLAQEGYGGIQLTSAQETNDPTVNLWLTAPKGATPVTWSSATDWQMAG
jgi:hypothetical protein